MQKHVMLSLSIIFLLCCCALLAAQVVHAPACRLCLVQQGVYALIGITAFLGLLSNHQIIPKILVFGFVALFVTASYHALIQLGILTGPCSRTTNLDTIENFISSLEKPSCAEITWKFLGCPASITNVLVSVFGGSFVYTFILLRSTTADNQSENIPKND